jgi:TetR/AcrR family transcriptional regulator
MNALSPQSFNRQAPTDAPVSGKTRGGEANVERILDAALSVFSIDGYGGARIDAIAAMAGLSKPNLLYYFNSKAALYLAVLRRTLDMWLEPLAAIDGQSEPKAALKAYVTSKLEQSRDYPEASRLFAMEVMRGAPILNEVLANDLKALVDEKTQLLARWMEEGRLPKRSPHHLLFMIWATTQHYADFAAQVEALRGVTLKDEPFFAETLENLLMAYGLA